MLIGENGAGKSTFCEAVMIGINAENPHHTHWSEKTTFGMNDWAIRLFQNDELHSVVYDGVTRSPKWHYRDQNTTRQKYSDTSSYCALWIQSDHLRVISGEPGERRAFLDDMLASADRQYATLLRNYRTSVSQRNKVLQNIQEGLMLRKDLASWNTLLAQNAIPLITQRHAMFHWMGSFSDEILHLPGPIQVNLIERHPLTDNTVAHYLALIQQFEDRDVIVGKTTIGPHLDDIAFNVQVD